MRPKLSIRNKEMNIKWRIILSTVSSMCELNEMQLVEMPFKLLLRSIDGFFYILV